MIMTELLVAEPPDDIQRVADEEDDLPNNFGWSNILDEISEMKK